MNYYISDLHFGCQNKYEGRTLDHDKLIKENWNKTVTNGDTVYILGDVGREGGNKEMEYLCEIISTLKGKKVPIQGNHEKLKDIRVKQLFTEIVPYGKKTYQEMDPEERAVIDEFEGELSYKKTLSKPEYFLYSPKNSITMIETKEAIA